MEGLRTTKGFAAALAVLITRASQSRQHGVISKAFRKRSALRVNHFSSSLKAINPSLCIMSQSIPEQLNDSSATSVDLREGFPFQSVTVLSNEGSVHLILLARRYSTLESLDIGLSQHWSTLVDGLEII
ncbi:hypothetical protein Tco_1145470 [Tanacetum coccineum]